MIVPTYRICENLRKSAVKTRLRNQYSARRPRSFEELRPCRAFTLIELLAVIAIIGILAALLFPMIGRMTASAEAAKCVNNLRQIGAAAVLYATDNDGYIPPSRAGWSQTQYWPWLLNAKMDQNYTSPAPYRQDTPFVCKSALKLGSKFDFVGGSPALGLTSTYAVNIGIAPALTNPNWQGVRRKFAGLPNPAATAFYTDAGGGGFAFSFYSAPSFVYPHNGKANVLFCDGHIESRTKEQIPTDRADVFYSGNVVTYTP